MNSNRLSRCLFLHHHSVVDWLLWLLCLNSGASVLPGLRVLGPLRHIRCDKAAPFPRVGLRMKVFIPQIEKLSQNALWPSFFS